MDQLSLVYIIVFCAVLMAVQGTYWFITERRRTVGSINRRLAVAMQSANTQEAYEELRRERWLFGLDSSRFAYFNELVTQSGLRLDGRTLVVISFSLGVIYLLVFGYFLDFGVLAFAAALSSAVITIFMFFVITRQKRIARFSEQLPDAIDVIVRGVKSGYPFTVALDLVGKEMPDPIGTEFGLTSDEINFGTTVGVALDHLYRRVGLDDLLYVTMAIKIQTDTGGNLAEILQRLARLIRERTMLRLKVKSITAEGRLSAVFLTVFPFLLFAVINLISPGFYGGVADNPAIKPAIIVGLVLLGLGNLVIYRMVNFKV